MSDLPGYDAWKTACPEYPWFCPRCDTQNEEEALHCKECGHTNDPEEWDAGDDEEWYEIWEYQSGEEK
jgi:hypothetical protein